MKDRFTVIPKFSLTPAKLAVYNEFIPNYEKDTSIPGACPGVPATRHAATIDLFPQPAVRHALALKQIESVSPGKPVEVKARNHHNFELSNQARKNLRNKVTWLYHFAKSKTITTTNGKTLFNFKMNFVTLKLPATQRHTSDFITKNCLNQLITECASKWAMVNYVWRLEYQKNGNLHYHIATDSYIDYYWLRKTWNRIIAKLDYIADYSARFKAMNRYQYYQLAYSNAVKNSDQRVNDRQAFFAAQMKVYNEQSAGGWQQPNTVDVKMVTNSKNIAFYISKYMGKSSIDNAGKSLPVCENNSKNSRLWFCSRSLSRCKSVSDYCEAFSYDIEFIIKSCHKVKRIVSDYCTVYYFNIIELPVQVREVLSGIFSVYRREVAYD